MFFGKKFQEAEEAAAAEVTKLQEELQREEEEYEREEAELQRLDEQGNSWVYFIIVLWADYLEESAQVNMFQWTPCNCSGKTRSVYNSLMLK